jgi:hypothetical protein
MPRPAKSDGPKVLGVSGGEKLGDIILKLMAKEDRRYTAKELAEMCMLPVKSINRAIGWLEKDGRLIVKYETKTITTPVGNYVKPVFGSYTYELKKGLK